MCLPNKLPNNDVLKNVKTSEYDLALKNDLCLGNDMPPKYTQVPVYDTAPVNDMAHENDLVPKTFSTHVTNEPNAYADKASKASGPDSPLCVRGWQQFRWHFYYSLFFFISA